MGASRARNEWACRLDPADLRRRLHAPATVLPSTPLPRRRRINGLHIGVDADSRSLANAAATGAGRTASIDLTQAAFTV